MKKRSAETCCDRLGLGCGTPHRRPRDLQTTDQTRTGQISRPGSRSPARSPRPVGWSRNGYHPRPVRCQPSAAGARNVAPRGALCTRSVPVPVTGQHPVGARARGHPRPLLARDVRPPTAGARGEDAASTWPAGRWSGSPGLQWPLTNGQRSIYSRRVDNRVTCGPGREPDVTAGARRREATLCR
jgi:hypothetical protein